MDYYTDSLKALAARHGDTVEGLLAVIKDLGLAVRYVARRKTWVLAEDAKTIRRFNEFLVEMNED